MVRILKQELAVKRVIDTLRGNRPVRQLITRDSQANLTSMAIHDPNSTGRLLDMLLNLHRIAIVPLKIVVPRNLGEFQNAEALYGLTVGLVNIVRLIDSDHVLDFRRANLRSTLGHYEVPCDLKKPTLEGEIETAIQSRQELERRQDLGNLVLFRALMAARMELYAIGEEKSAAKDPALRQRSVENMVTFGSRLQRLIEVFPFNAHSEWRHILGRLVVARKLVLRLNDPAVDAVLVSLSDRLLREMGERQGKLENQFAENKTTTVDLRQDKIRFVGASKKDCIVIARGYKRSESGVLYKTLIERKIDISKLARMARHQIESIDAEKAKNEKLIADLNLAYDNYPGFFDKLFEACITLSSFKDIGKRKAHAELVCAIELVKVRTDQSRRLAKDMIYLAIRDLEIRNKVLDVQIEYIRKLEEAAFEIQADAADPKRREILDFVDRWVEYFLKKPDLSSPRTLSIVEKRLRPYFGTLFKKDDENYFIRQARSHLIGVLEGIKNGNDPHREVKAARKMLEIEFDYRNQNKEFEKGKRQIALMEFYKVKAAEYGEWLLSGLPMEFLF